MDLRFLVSIVVLAGALASATAVLAAGETHPAPARDAEPDALAFLGRMVGGTWVGEAKGPDGKPFVEFRYEWGPEHKSLRATGRIADTRVESRFAWDPVEKKVYYLDSHGPNTVYFGHCQIQGEELILRFKTLVGPPGEWEARAHWPDKDTYVGRIEAVKDGKPSGDGHDIRLHRVGH